MKENSYKPTVVSLFAGCGGLDLGFLQAGYDVIWANDFFEDAVKTDLGISITGISGPTGGTKTKPVGLYYIGIKHKNIHFIKNIKKLKKFKPDIVLFSSVLEYLEKPKKHINEMVNLCIILLFLIENICMIETMCPIRFIYFICFIHRFIRISCRRIST